ncbi:MAG: START domain-containing protein [Chthoniobacteraceae bacterium]
MSPASGLIPRAPRCALLYLVFGLALATPILAADSGATPADEGWKAASTTADLTIFNRSRKGSSLKEFKAIGVIEAEPIVVRRVLEDTPEFPRFMPYVTEARVISRQGDTRISYQRISVPLVGDRDYTMRAQWEAKRLADGRFSYRSHWQPAKELGPVETPGVTRVKVNEGQWLLEPAGLRQTRATYRIFCDPGGSLPAMVLNSANKTAIPKLFEAIRKQVRLEKYSRVE